MVQWCGLVWFNLDKRVEPSLALPGLLLQQVEPGVDLVSPQVAAGSGDLPATGRWFDFF